MEQVHYHLPERPETDTLAIDHRQDDIHEDSACDDPYNAYPHIAARPEKLRVFFQMEVRGVADIVENVDCFSDGYTSRDS